MMFSSGHTSAHHCCAAWSDGVLQTEEFMLQFVDKAVSMGLSKVWHIYMTTLSCTPDNEILDLTLG